MVKFEITGEVREPTIELCLIKNADGRVDVLAYDGHISDTLVSFTPDGKLERYCTGLNGIAKDKCGKIIEDENKMED